MGHVVNVRGYVSKWRGANVRIGIVADHRATQTALLEAMQADGFPESLREPLFLAVRDRDRNWLEKVLPTIRRIRMHRTADHLRHLLIVLGNDERRSQDLPKPGS